MESKNKEWSPYLAGALTGLVIIVSAWIDGRYFGASTFFVRVSGFIGQIFSAEHLNRLDYFRLFVPEIDWQVMMVVGILIGSFISSITSGSFKIKAVPDMWESHFGSSRLKRGVVSFVGGAVLIFGARLAGGCPSGHGLAQMVQLSVSGLIALLCFFAGGIVVAKILYRGGTSK